MADMEENPAQAQETEDSLKEAAEKEAVSGEAVEGGVEEADNPTAAAEEAATEGTSEAAPTAEAADAEAPGDGAAEQPVAAGEESPGGEGGEAADEAAPEQQEATEAAAPADEEQLPEGKPEEVAPGEAGEEGSPTDKGAEGEEGAPVAEAADATVAEAEEKPEGEEPSSPKADTEGEEASDEEAQAEARDGATSGDGLATVEEGDEEEPQEQQEQQEQALQSDTFAEGERPESPIAIGEKLSREGTPTEREEVPGPEALEPGTPEAGSDAELEEYEEQEDYEEEEEEMPVFDRDQLLEAYHQAIAEREQFQQQNYQLQHKLAEYFRKKKSDESRQDIDKNVTDQEQRYLKYMANLDELRRQDADERELFKLQIEELKERCGERQDRVDEERIKFMEFKKHVAVNAVNSRSGKPIQPKDIEQYLAQENKKEAEVVNVRLENIKLKNKLKKKELQLKSKEELAEGLHLIDFEQLKIENQTYNEKIEERNEELLKLRKKITSTVQVLTHLKEKLQFVQGENHVLKDKLHDVEDHAAKKRDVLSRTKQARDGLRIDNQKLRQNCGLLGNEPLLRDFEDRKDEGDDLREKLESLKIRHAELTLTCNGVRKKIEQARVGTQA